MVCILKHLIKTTINFIFVLFIFVGCTTQRTTQIEKVIYRDSTVFHTDTVFVSLPRETITDVVLMWDTLYLDSEVAKAEAYIDYETKTLKGTLKNKDSIKTIVQYKDRYIYKDSLIYEPQPYKVVEYKTPRWMKWYLTLTILGGIIIILIKTRRTWLTNFQRILH